MSGSKIKGRLRCCCFNFLGRVGAHRVFFFFFGLKFPRSKKNYLGGLKKIVYDEKMLWFKPVWQVQKGKGKGEMSKSGEMVPYPLSPIPLPFSHTGYCGSSLTAQ